MKEQALLFFTEYYQFYIRDAESNAQTDAVDFWNETADKNKIAVGDGLLGITVAKYAEINVTIKLCDTSPPLDEAADHIVDAPLHVSSGKLQVLNCTNFDLKYEALLEKDNYTVRASSYKLDTVQGDKGDDYYVIEIWRAFAEKVNVLKTFDKR